MTAVQLYDEKSGVDTHVQTPPQLKFHFLFLKITIQNKILLLFDFLIDVYFMYFLSITFVSERTL